MRVLVTGGLGFIGSHVADALVARGDEVVVVDNLHPSAHAADPGGRNPAVRYVTGDLRDRDLAAELVADVDAVSHQASIVGLGVSFEDVTLFVEHNDGATAVLLAALARRRFAGRLVLAGSCVVYGESPGRCPDHGLRPARPRRRELLEAGSFDHRCAVCERTLAPESLAEDAAPDPRSVYAATKLHQEHLTAAFARETAASVVALRYHNVYGPRMPRDTPYAGVAAIFRSELEAGRPPRVFEDGAQQRDFVHVSDVAASNLLALDADHSGWRAYNVASGVPHTVGDMAVVLSQRISPGLQPAVTGEYRLGDVRHVLCSPDRIQAELGFAARVGFEQGMAEFATAPLRAATVSPAAP